MLCSHRGQEGVTGGACLEYVRQQLQQQQQQHVLTEDVRDGNRPIALANLRPSDLVNTDVMTLSRAARVGVEGAIAGAGLSSGSVGSGLVIDAERCCDDWARGDCSDARCCVNAPLLRLAYSEAAWDRISLRW